MFRPFILILAFLADVALVHQPSFALPFGANSQNVDQHPPSFSDHNVRVFVRGPGGAFIDQLALVILTSMRGEVQEANTQADCAEFAHVPEGWYDVEVIAAGYDDTKWLIKLAGSEADSFTVTLKVASGPHSPTDKPGVPILAPKAKQELGKAQEALHAGKLTAAKNHLDTAYRLAPANPGVNYVFGIYFIQTNELEKARGYLEKAVNLDPMHARALQALGIVFLRENIPVEAIPYLKRAIEAEPKSWRSHALLAEVWLRMGLVDESVKQSERALQLGHGPAAVVEPLLARALARRGEIERAIRILEKYVKEHASDAVATKQLQDLRTVSQPKLTTEAQVTSVELPLASQAALTTVAALLPSSWLPPDIDEAIPPVEPRITVVEYGPVNFRKRTVQLWLPQTAEFYYDWRGHRGHRVHRFSNYLLFSMDDEQRISVPNAGNESPMAR